MAEPQPGPDGEVFRPSFPDIDPSERPYTQVSYGIPFDKACKKHIDGFLKASRVYVIASKSLASQTDHLNTLEATLGDKHVGSWLGIPAHTPYDALVPILKDMREKKADCLVTLGGGSLSDGGKAIVYCLENNAHTLSDIQSLGKKFTKITEKELAGVGNAPKIPIVFLPTTLAGAEYSKYAGCTDPENHLKTQWTHPNMFASLVILDPDLCRSTPDWVWRSTGVRGIDHCVENICSSNPRKESDVACEKGLVKQIRGLMGYIRNPDDLDARLQSQLGTNYAMTGLALLVMCGASHGIGHQLGPLGVGHGQTSCILLPSVMKYNAKVNQSQQDIIKRILWSEDDIVEVLKKHGLEKEESDAGDALRAIFDELEMPRTLKDVGVVGKDKWETLAKNSLTDSFCQRNPIPIEREEQVYEILRMVEG